MPGTVFWCFRVLKETILIKTLYRFTFPDVSAIFIPVGCHAGTGKRFQYPESSGEERMAIKIDQEPESTSQGRTHHIREYCIAASLNGTPKAKIIPLHDTKIYANQGG